jgi:hypothetical protein
VLTIKLDHPSDPRYLLVAAAPAIVTPEAVFRGDYGKPLLMSDGEPDLVYPQPDGPGTDWIHPDIVEDVRLRRENARLRRELSES